MKRFILKHALALTAALGLVCGWLVVEVTAAGNAVFVKTTGVSPFFIDTSKILTNLASSYSNKRLVLTSGGVEAIYRIKAVGTGASSFTTPGEHGAYLESESVGSSFDGYNITSWRIENVLGPRDKLREKPKTVAVSDSLTVLPETTTYINRVQAGGGTVVSQSDVNASIWHAQLNGYWNNVVAYHSGQFGVKTDSGTAGVSTWYDLSPNMTDASGSTIYTPTWTAGQQNGKAMLVFTAANSTYLTLGKPTVMNFATSSAYSAFMVAQYTNGAGGYALARNNAAGSGPFSLVLTPTEARIFDPYRGTPTTFTMNAGQVALLETSCPITAGNGTGWLNGTTQTALTRGAEDSTGYDIDWLFGARRNNTNTDAAAFFGGKIGCNLVLNSAVTAAQRLAIESFLNSRWAVY